eukprot:10726522-Alexandrium_andersonii.AAC.1
MARVVRSGCARAQQPRLRTSCVARHSRTFSSARPSRLTRRMAREHCGAHHEWTAGRTYP